MHERKKYIETLKNATFCEEWDVLCAGERGLLELGVGEALVTGFISCGAFFKASTTLAISD
jgi:hypothetical protein